VAGGVSANMLTLAKALCSIALPDQQALNNPIAKAPQDDYPPLKSKLAPFVLSNGDWEMWMNLCSRFNATVVRVYGWINSGNAGNAVWTPYLKALYYGSADAGTTAVGYPSSAPVLDHNKVVRTGITADNYYPACLQKAGDTVQGESATIDPPPDAVQRFVSNVPLPPCPAEFLANGKPMWINLANSATSAEPEEIDKMRAWTLHGAINAGMSVFSYLQMSAPDLVHQGAKPYYNECQLLP
jgi:hypothetical protein